MFISWHEPFFIIVFPNSTDIYNKLCNNLSAPAYPLHCLPVAISENEMATLNFSFEDLPTSLLEKTDQLIGFSVLDLV